MAARVTSIIVLAIVAATIIAGIIARAQRDDSGPVDLIVLNGKIYTGQSGGRFQEAVAVRGNQIVRVGPNRDIKRLRRPQTQVIDAHGGTVLPGFNDARIPLLRNSPAAGEINLFLAPTLEEIQDAVRAFAEAEPDRSWIVGRGWSHMAFAGGVPTRQQLDAAVTDRPVYLVSRDGRTGWANSKALALAGITRRTAAPNGGIIIDSRTGEPTGVLTNQARERIERLLTHPSKEDRLHALRAALLDANRAGITSIQSAGDDPADLALYEELRRAGDLTARVYGVLAAEQASGDAVVMDRLDQVREQYPDDPLLKAGAIAVRIDQPIGTNASSRQQDTGRNRRSASYTVEELSRTIVRLDQRRWQIILEVSGEEATKLALEAYSHAFSESAGSRRDNRHRLTGLGIIDPDDLSRLDESDLIVEQLVTPLMPILKSAKWSTDGGADHANAGLLWQTFAEREMHVVLGSDAPRGLSPDDSAVRSNDLTATLPDPMGGLFAVVSGMPSTPFEQPSTHPETNAPLRFAVDAYTRNGAYASFDEHRKGLLAPGMLADIVILSTDIFSLPPERLLEGRVDVTIFDGKVVFQRSASPPATN